MLSFANGAIGGTCSEEEVLPYLFDALYGLMIIAQLVFIFEKIFGFGAQRFVTADQKEDNNDGKKKNKP